MAKKAPARKKPAPAADPAPAAAAADVVRTVHGEDVPAAELAHLHPAVRCFAVRADALTRDPTNARRHGERNLTAIANSLRKYGQQPSGLILFDPATRHIKVGSGRHEAATDPKWGVNWRWVAAAPSNLSAAELKAFAIADNRTSELGDWDPATLERQLADLGEDLDGFELGDVGFDAAELDALYKGKVSEAHGFVPPKPSKPPAEKPAAAQWLVIIRCESEAHQAELIEECERRGLDCTAPSA
ncbi:MAG TPA: hypothetical protein VF796_01875 [Humisphaera sp.]